MNYCDNSSEVDLISKYIATSNTGKLHSNPQKYQIILCPGIELFDEGTRKCTKENDVECGERPVLVLGKTVGDGRPVVQMEDDGCTEFYQCINQKKMNSGQCPNGLKFNVLTIRCDWIKNNQRKMV
ncbi:hypothetical protein SNEBB_008285 [Seison nebaliae]|nr:hypothetical protein SNEBB_008285 [Seison nebaliae]